MKPTLLLMHGLFGGLSNWHTVIENFKNDFDIHAPVLPIFDNHKINDLDYLVNFLNNYVEEKKLNNVTLIGNSLGGHISILYTYRFPQKVNKLVLTGSSGLFENNTFGSFPRRHDYNYIRERVEYTFHNRNVATKEMVDEVYDIVCNPAKCIRIIRIAKSAQRHYAIDELKNINHRVLLIWGINDNITPINVAKEFKSYLKNSELIYIPNCGHVSMMESPLEFNRILEDFLKP